MNRKYCIKAIVPNCEIRKVERVPGSFIGKNGKEIDTTHLIVQIDDEEMNRIYLKDKCLANEENYKRGMIGDAELLINVEDGFGGKTTVLLRRFRPKED